MGIVGVNRSPQYVSFEGRRKFVTDGKKYKHPSQEAAEAECRLNALVRPSLDELVLLRFEATNRPPYPFAWVDETEMAIEYSASLLRIAREYEARF